MRIAFAVAILIALVVGAYGLVTGLITLTESLLIIIACSVVYANFIARR